MILPIHMDLAQYQNGARDAISYIILYRSTQA